MFFFFYIANTLFLSGKEVKRQKHISAQLLPESDKAAVDTVVISSFSPLFISSFLSSLPPFSCSFAAVGLGGWRGAQHDTDLLSTKVKDKGFDCTSIHPPYLARHSPFFSEQTCKICVWECICVYFVFSDTERNQHMQNNLLLLMVFFRKLSFFKSKCGREVLKLMAIVLPNKQTLKSYIGGSGCQNP